MNNKDKEDFKLTILSLIKLIPIGRATSYGVLAKSAGYPNMSRMVGKIVSECNSVENDIPAHRVVNSHGLLSGKAAFGNSDEMKHLLEADGITIINDKIQDWQNVLWNPLKEIDI